MQLDEEQEPHDDDAEWPVVSPPVPLLIKPHADISFFTFLLSQEGQNGFSFPNTMNSKS